ncbi:MAG: hypothetical protein PHN52_00230 [candidate division Zixibacteria bacterium]|nr:hypothetical protein [candidate division Zixibacteria bacterium]
MKKYRPLILTLSMMVLAAAGLAASVNYVSFNGEFYITYPDNWYQVDYNTVDYYLSSIQANRESYQYEAVFAERKSIPFHAGNYLILTLEKVGKLDNRQVDSLLADLDSVFAEGRKYFPSGNLLSDLKSNTLYYDRANKTITLLSEMSDDNQVLKKNIWTMKLYDKGIANFYFYSPDSVYEASKAVLNDIVSSFSTENISQAMPKEQLRISDTGNKGIYSTLGLIITPAAALIVIIILAVYIRRRRK